MLWCINWLVGLLILVSLALFFYNLFRQNFNNLISDIKQYVLVYIVLVIILYHLFVPLEKKESPSLSTTTAFSTESYMNGWNPAWTQHASSRLPEGRRSSHQGTESESQPRPFSRNPSHPLLSIHHTLFEDEEEQNRRDRLARPGELIAAGECWRKMQINTCTHTECKSTYNMNWRTKEYAGLS